MHVRNLVEILVDMQDKEAEILKIVNLYCNNIPDVEKKRDFLKFLKLEIEKALGTDE